MRRSLLVLVSIFWILSSCKARQDASATKADISVGHTWWDNVVKVLNDTASRTDQAKKGTDLLADKVNEAKTNKATSQRRVIQAQVEKSRTEIAALVQQVSTLLDTLKTTLSEGSTSDIQQGEKKYPQRTRNPDGSTRQSPVGLGLSRHLYRSRTHQ